jgi:hypothetical protein
VATKGAAVAEIHPVIAALEKVDEPTVVIHGFVGTSEDPVLRLYEALDMSAYVEIPKAAVVYVEADEGGSPGAVRAFVRASEELLTVRRFRIRAEDFMRKDRIDLPPIEPKPTFWTCAAGCEGTFVDLVQQIFVDEARAFGLPPDQQQVLLAQIAQRKQEAKRALFFCLSNCADRYGIPPFLAVPDPTAPGGFRVERFTAAKYHQILVERHLEKPG